MLNRKARDSQQDQALIFMNSWEDFSARRNADNYDKNMRWLGSRPWIQIVTPDQIVNGEIDISVPPDRVGDQWGTVNRGTGLYAGECGQGFIDHATEENYDNWYNGSGLEESLRDKTFNIRTGVAPHDHLRHRRSKRAREFSLAGRRRHHARTRNHRSRYSRSRRAPCLGL